ncbi:MAG TPA: hypothetical protein VN493_19290 [Thermoanaerobaculia bacterium]|nr:hypothetical protein [Thermoanaerobaculia bacterium]
MRKHALLWTLLLLGMVAVPVLAQDSPPAANPNEPELFIPQPNYVCKGGMCSSTSQCQEWHGPDWICNKQPGQGCGYCIELAVASDAASHEEGLQCTR